MAYEEIRKPFFYCIVYNMILVRFRKNGITYFYKGYQNTFLNPLNLLKCLQLINLL